MTAKKGKLTWGNRDRNAIVKGLAKARGVSLGPVSPEKGTGGEKESVSNHEKRTYLRKWGHEKTDRERPPEGQYPQ
jgi:hypothetical protein